MLAIGSLRNVYECIFNNSFFFIDENRPKKLIELNCDVLRDIFDHLDLTEIVALQHVCVCFQKTAQYHRKSAKFELHSVAKHRFGVMVNWFKKTKSILQRYGCQITDLDADYNYFTNRKTIDELSQIVRALCNQLEVYTIRGLIRYPDVRAGQLCRPNFMTLHTLRLCNFNRSTTDEDVSEFLVECKESLRFLHIESMWLTGQFLTDATERLESLELIHLFRIEFSHIIAYLERNSNLKRFEFETRGLFRCVPTHGFLERFTKVEHFKLKVDNRSNFMCYMNVSNFKDFTHLKSLELDVYKLFSLEQLFVGLANRPLLERLSITLKRPLEDNVLQSLQRLEKLQYLRVNFHSDLSAQKMDSMLQAIGNAGRLTDLEIMLPDHYECDLTVLYASLPYIQRLKIKMGSHCTGLQYMASLHDLSYFEIRIVCNDDVANVVNQFVTTLHELWAIQRLVVTLLSSAEFSPNLLSEFEELSELGIKSADLKDCYELGRIAVGRIFTIPLMFDVPHCVQLVTGLINNMNCYQLPEIIITGEVNMKREY